MAGIGFELKKIYGRKTLASNVWGTIYATMTTVGPTVLSALLMLVLNFLLGRGGLTVLESRFFISSTTYAFLTALLTSSFFSAPVSRYIADCVYLGKESEIFPSAFGVLAVSSALSGAVMLLMCLGVYFHSPEAVPVSFLAVYYLLGVLVTDAYILMNYASALKHYRTLTFSFALGLVLAVAAYLLCDRWLKIDKVIAAYAALVCCFFVVVFALIFQCVKAFGAPRGRHFAVFVYFRRYPVLAVGGAVYMLGLYCPTIVYWFFSEMAERVSIFRSVLSYDMAMFLAFVVNIPSLVIFVVKVETAFYEKYTLYVSALNNGTLDMLRKERGVMTRALLQELFFVYEVQLIITVVLVCLISVFFPYLNVSIHMLHMFVMLSLGICTVFCMYFTIVVFYYFSDYDGACISALVFLAVTLLVTAAVVRTNAFYFLSLPLLVGGLCGWTTSFLLLRRRMEKLDSFLMC